MKESIAGVLPVLHTPFVDGKEIDWPTLQREVDWALQVGSQGVVAAMVSEILRLTIDERQQLAEKLVELVDDRGVVITSVGSESLVQSLQLTRQAAAAGCTAVMAIPPVATAASHAQTEHYFCELANATDLPLIVQDASSYVGGSLPIELYIRLLDRFGPDKLLFKPEAAPIGPRLSELRDQSDGRAKIFDGSGGVLLIDAYRRGIAGTMPGTDLLDGIVAVWNELQAGDDDAAYRVAFPLSAIVNLQLQAGLDGFLAIEKYLLVKRGIFENDSRRSPYGYVLDPETRAEVDRLFDRMMQRLTR